MSNQNELTIEERSGCLWITLPDSITMYDNRELEQRISRQLRDRKDHVVLDFSNTRAVYSSGLGLMIRLRRFVTERGGTLSLVNVAPAVHDMFTALKIDKVFTMYPTDVEFEISRADFTEKKEGGGALGFLFVSKAEHGSMRFNVSGAMTADYNLSPCKEFQPSTEVKLYLFDLSGLEIIDSAGAEAFAGLTARIAAAGGTARAYGAHGMILDTLTLLNADNYLTFFTDEKSAYEGVAPLNR
jgi:anti-anti-sigma factor